MIDRNAQLRDRMKRDRLRSFQSSSATHAAAVIVVLVLGVCGLQPATALPNVALLLVPAESKINHIEANFAAPRAGNYTYLTTLTYSLVVDGGQRSIELDPRRGNTDVRWIQPGHHLLTTLLQHYVPSWPSGAPPVTHSLQESLNVAFDLRAGWITVLPYKFVYVLVNEDAGIGTIALKMRPLTQEEADAIVADLDSTGVLRSWAGITFGDGPPRESVYPLFTGVPVVLRTVSDEYPPISGRTGASGLPLREPRTTSSSQWSPASRPSPPSTASLHCLLGTGWPDLLNASLSFTALRPLEVQAGVGGLLYATGYFVRGGLGWLISDHRDLGGSGRTQDLTLLAGYRSMDLGSEPFLRGVSIVAQLRQIRWPRAGQGLAVETDVTAGVILMSSPPSGAGSAWLDLCLAGGLAF